MAHERLRIRRGERLVEGIVTDVIKAPNVFSEGLDQIVDAVLFRETGTIVQFPRKQE